MKKNNLPYNKFAEIYDRIGVDRFSLKMLNYTFEILRRRKYYPKTILDLCCGTGTVAGEFASYGFDVTGLDRSKKMLAAAKKKAKTNRLNIKFVNQSLPDFEIIDKKSKEPKKFGLITCFYDSVNYLLTKTEIRKLFRAVYRHLSPGGYFIFDMNTAHAFQTIWSKTYAGEKDGIAWIYESRLNEKTDIVDLTTTFFVQKGKLWEKFSEIHTERAFENEFLREILTKAGLEVTGFYRCFKFKKPIKSTNRIAIVARKPLG